MFIPLLDEKLSIFVTIYGKIVFKIIKKRLYHTMLLAVFLIATWSSVFAFGKMILSYASPLFLTGTRMLLASFFLIGYLIFRKRKALKITTAQFFPIALLAFLSIYLTNALEFWSLQHLSAAKTCFIYSLSPFFAAFFS